MLPPKLILSPIDFSDSSQAALEVAADFAARFGAELLLVHVMPAIEDLPTSVSVFKEGEYDLNLFVYSIASSASGAASGSVRWTATKSRTSTRASIVTPDLRQFSRAAPLQELSCPLAHSRGKSCFPAPTSADQVDRGA